MQGDPTVSFYSADVSGIDWMVRHGRSLALSVAVNVAPSRLCAGKYSSEVQDMILSNAVADRVRLCGSLTSPAPPPANTPWPEPYSHSSGEPDWVVRGLGSSFTFASNLDQYLLSLGLSFII